MLCVQLSIAIRFVWRCQDALAALLDAPARAFRAHFRQRGSSVHNFYFLMIFLYILLCKKYLFLFFFMTCRPLRCRTTSGRPLGGFPDAPETSRDRGTKGSKRASSVKFANGHVAARAMAHGVGGGGPLPGTVQLRCGAVPLETT